MRRFKAGKREKIRKMLVYKNQVDPMKLAEKLWPETYFYKQQREIIYSVWNNDETIVPAGNMLGKDFVAGRLIVLFFLTRNPVRIVTTSAKDDHLRVLWGEMKQCIQESTIPLEAPYGPLYIKHHEIRKDYRGQQCPISYIKGMVANPDSIASMQGHHANPKKPDGKPHTLFVSDESSSVPDEYFRMVRTWAHRMLILGNPWQCSNYFYKSVEGDPSTNDPGGDILAPT